MNILIPHQWLLEHLETKATPKQIQEYVSLSGPSVERIYQLEGEPVYDVEITTNRVDSMSVRGFAREAAVILTRFDLESHLKPLNLPAIEPTTKALPLPEVNNDPSLSSRVLAVVLANSDQTPTPDWMAKRLKQIEQNVHNSQIDITNYITHDLGHPCHAFDYDKIMKLGGKIDITTAKAGEKFQTLDGENYETVGGEIVFKNDEGEIIDLPAVKGTSNTSVDDSTQNILLWIENLDPKKVRYASMSHAIRTVAAQLNEKGVDPVLGEVVIKQGAQLYQQLTGAEIASELLDIFPTKSEPEPVKVKKETIDTYLGLELETQEIEAILEQLGCEVSTNAGVTEVKPPSFRPDLEIPADIVEEVARIYGYHKLPSTLMTGKIPTNYPDDADFEFEAKLRHYLDALGWQEIYTYSMVSQELALESGYELEDQLKLLNPLTEDRVYLRRSLVPSLKEALDNNPEYDQLSFFELANIYLPREAQIPEHQMRLSLVSNRPYREVRGDLEALLSKFYLSQIEFRPTELSAVSDSKLYSQAAKVMLTPQLPEGGRGEEIELGLAYVLTDGSIAIDLSYQQLIEAKRKYPYYEPISSTSPIIEDITLTIKEGQPIGPIMDLMLKEPLVDQVHLKDIYQRNYTFQIRYLDRKENLTNRDLQPVRQRLISSIQDKFEAKLVGSV